MKSRIALCFIYGNEAKNIERFLDSFAPVADKIFACRAVGNADPDLSREAIEDFCLANHIEVRLIEYKNERDFFHVDNFAKARQKAWMQPGDEFTHLMWADCDDTLAPGSADAIRVACDNATEDVFILPYHVRQGDKQIVMRERIVKNTGFSSWHGALHEALRFNRDISFRVIKDAVFIHSPYPLRATSAPRNKAILLAAVEDNGRHYFYLAQEAFECGNIADLKSWGALALASPALDSIMMYETLLNLAQVETEPEKARTLAARAYHEMPDRREALALMANFHILDGEYEKAHELAKVMMHLPIPAKTYWSLNREWYDWKGFYLYTQTLRLIDKKGEADRLELNRHIKAGQKISLIHATRGRPQQALACREMWLSRADKPDQVEHIFCFDQDDKTSLPLEGFKNSWKNPEIGAGCVAAWNIGAIYSIGEILVQLSDDWIPPKGWDTAIIERIGDISTPAVLAVADGRRNDDLLCMAIMTRRRYEDQGFMFHPDFKSVYSDNYFTEMAKKDGVIIDAQDLVFIHNHPAFEGNPLDNTYQESNSPERYAAGKSVFDRLMEEEK
jgi:hypothetical protein